LQVVNGMLCLEPILSNFGPVTCLSLVYLLHGSRWVARYLPAYVSVLFGAIWNV
jgi:hypothetical protein